MIRSSPPAVSGSDVAVPSAFPDTLDAQAIAELLCRRFPMLLVDRVLKVQSGVSIRALKNVSYNEPYFCGHFPTRPLTPGVLLIEALVQTASLLWLLTGRTTRQDPSSPQLAGIKRVRFRQPVLPGDRLYLSAQLADTQGDMSRFSTAACVDENEVVCAQIELR